MASETKKKFFKEVRPILSLDHHEARRRVLNLYKAWFRQIPFMVKYYDVEFSETRCKQKLREEFTKHPQINDIRIIDMLVIKNLIEMEVLYNRKMQTYVCQNVGTTF
ncbi:hypothetical protein YQE_02288, partial [Dendroctonus ponderosae]